MDLDLEHIYCELAQHKLPQSIIIFPNSTIPFGQMPLTTIPSGRYKQRTHLDSIVLRIFYLLSEYATLKAMDYDDTCLMTVVIQELLELDNRYVRRRQ
jgi:hypothetical protein